MQNTADTAQDSRASSRTAIAKHHPKSKNTHSPLRLKEEQSSLRDFKTVETRKSLGETQDQYSK
jgi:hypothetical protein